MRKNDGYSNNKNKLKIIIGFNLQASFYPVALIEIKAVTATII